MGGASNLFSGGAPSLTGGTAGPSRSGDASSGGGDTGGISSPVVIGGFKSNGEATSTASVLPSWFIPAAALVGLVVVFGLVRHLRR